MVEAVIVAAARSPIGRAGKGSLKDLRPDDMASQMVSSVLAKVPELDPTEIDDLILGTASPAGESGFNMARIVSVLCGFDSVPGVTVNRYCSSSLQTTRMAMHAIRAGEGDVFVSAGVESVSSYVSGTADGLPGTANPAFDGAVDRAFEMASRGSKWSDPRSEGRLPNPYMATGETAENVASLYGVTRAEQDEFGVRSQNLAEQAVLSGFWERDITPLTLPDGRMVRSDDGPRAGVTLQSVSELKPVFRADGTVTAANCCPLNDGAAALVIMSATKAEQLGITPLARIVATAVSALSPEVMGLGPIEASRRALSRAGMTAHDVDLFEINEAFAAQVVPTIRELELDIDKVNVHGGAIAVGHPFGMTGARITSTLLHALQETDQTIGLETMCVAGGQGMAMVVERLS